MSRDQMLLICTHMHNTHENKHKHMPACTHMALIYKELVSLTNTFPKIIDSLFTCNQGGVSIKNILTHITFDCGFQ